MQNCLMMKKVFCLVVLFIFAIAGYAQDTILMGVSGHKDTVSNYCVLFDDGGSQNPHSPRVNASYTIKATNPNYRAKVWVKSYLSHGNQHLASLSIQDSITPTNIYFSTYSNYYYLTYVNSDEITVTFNADDDNPIAGFEVIVQFCDCASPSDISYEYLDSTSLVLRWNGNGNTDFTIDYVVTTGGAPSYNLSSPYYQHYNVSTNADSVIISGFTPWAYINYNIYGTCDSVPMCGTLGYTAITPPCNDIRPVNVQVTRDTDSIYFDWDSITGVNWFGRIRWNSSWIPLAQNHYSVEKRCNDYAYIYIVGTNQSEPRYCDYYSYYSYFGCPNVSTLNIREVSPDAVTIWWDDIDTIDAYVVGYCKNGSSNVILADTVARGVQEYTFDELLEATEYTFYVYTLCDECGISSGNSITYKTSVDLCIDYADIISLDTYLTWGDYHNPYSDTTYNNYRWDGTNDYFWGTDRHVVIVDTNAYDWRTNYQLKKVPSGYKASIRLGNDNIGAQAESIAYEYTVDSTEYDMLILKYAVVLQDPDHDITNQPRFTLEILDENNQPIDSTCGFADFYASGDLGWNQVSGNSTNTLWKDWTTIGIDIAPYHEQTIRIRLTTYDCEEGGHFGYAYFTLNCDNKRIYLVNRCDATDSIHLQAPLGFDYKWYREGDTTLLSTNYDIIVPIDTMNYHCLASFVGKPECNFTISTIAINVQPHSMMTYRIDTCESKVYFENLSYLDFDTAYNAFTRQMVDTTFWEFDDGTFSPEDNPERYYPQNGVYDIKLISLLSDSYCSDTLNVPITIDFNFAKILAPDTVCQRDTVILRAEQFDELNSPNVSYLWNTQESTDSIMIVADQTNEYTLSVKDGEDCRGSAMKTIVVNPSYYDTIYHSICNNQTYVDDMFSADSTGLYTWNQQTDRGCDSLIALSLIVYPTYDTLIYDTICLGDVYNSNGFNEMESGIYVLNLQSVYGCDSVVRLNLHVLPSHAWNINAEICDNETYSLYDFSENEAGSYVHSFQNIYGCDSVVTLNLAVHPTYEYTISAEICQGETYAENDFVQSETGIYTRRLSSQYACDSIVHLDLIVHPVYNDTIYSELCGIAYEDNGFNETESGIYTQHLQTINGCDSLVTLHLTVWELFTDTLEVEIYKGETYKEHGFSENEAGEYDNVYTDLNGCDSAYHLNLHIINLMFPNMVSANGDGVNDIFEIHGLLGNSFFSYNELAIYSRHGRRVYYRENIKRKEDFWSPEATNTPSGTYLYRFKAKGKTRDFEFNGTVEVLR